MVLKRKLPSRTTEHKPDDTSASQQGNAPHSPKPDQEARMSSQGGADFEADLPRSAPPSSPKPPQQSAEHVAPEAPMPEAPRPRKAIDLDDILGFAPSPPSSQPPASEGMERPKPPSRPEPQEPDLPPRTQASAGIVPPPPSFADAPDVDDVPYSEDADEAANEEKPVKTAVASPPSAPRTEAPVAAPPPKKVLPDMPAKHAAEPDDADAWDLDEVVPPPSPANSASADPVSPVSGVYGAAPEVTAPYASPKLDSPKQPPWKHSSGTSETKREAPTLPSRPMAATVSKGGMLGAAGSLFVLGGLLFGIFMVYTNFDKATEMVARWTGALNQVSQDLPVEPPVAINHEASSATVIADADTVELAGESRQTATPSDKLLPPPELPQTAKTSGGAVVEFADVMPDEVQKPIVADGSESIPEDVNAFAKLMEKISEKRKEKRQTDSAKLPDEPTDMDPEDIPAEQRNVRNTEVIANVEDELAAYRKALSQTENPALKPRPTEFFNNEMPVPTATNAPAPKTYGNKVVREPVTNEPVKPETRTLMDFNLPMFEPPEEKVRMPRGLKPHLSASDFPALELLSLIPNYGLIGVSKGREGVLLLGDTYEGWELVNVRNAYAEFRFGDRKHIVSMKNANR